VDGRDVGDIDALWKDHEDVAPSLGASGRAVGRGASAGSEAWESAEGWFKGGGDARPVHSTAQNPFQDIMAQREMCSKGGASHAVVGVRAVEGGSADALHGGGIEGQDGEAEAMLDGSLELPALSRAIESGRVSSQADAGRQAQLRSRAQARLPSSVPSCKEASKASARAWAECRQ
jgi:hypothetical protein